MCEHTCVKGTNGTRERERERERDFDYAGNIPKKNFYTETIPYRLNSSHTHTHTHTTLHSPALLLVGWPEAGQLGSAISVKHRKD